MDAEQRANALFDKAKRNGMVSSMTGDGAPSRGMVTEAIQEAEWDAGQCGEAFLGRLEKRIEYHKSSKSGNPAEMDNTVMLALINVRDAYKEAFSL